MAEASCVTVQFPGADPKLLSHPRLSEVHRGAAWRAHHLVLQKPIRRPQVTTPLADLATHLADVRHGGT